MLSSRTWKRCITGGGTYNPSTHTITWSLGDVPISGHMQLSFDARVIFNAPLGAIIKNYASITYSGGGPVNTNTVTTTVTAGGLDHFTFEPVPSPQRPGQPFPVTIYARDAQDNTLTSFAESVNLSDLSGTIFPSTSGNFSSGVYTGEVTISAACMADSITAEYGGKSGASNTFDVVPHPPDLSASSKAVNLSEAMPGAVLSYTIHVINSGQGDATQVVVNDPLDPNLEEITGISGGGIYDPAAHKITWDLGTLAPAAQRELSFTARVKNSSAPGTVIENRADVDCLELSPMLTNKSSATVIHGPLHHFEVEDIASPQIAGQPFPITVTAKDAYGNTVTIYNGQVNLTGSGSGNLVPREAAGFLDGYLELEVVYDTAEAIVITVADAEQPGLFGQSTIIEVKYPPLSVGAATPCVIVAGETLDILEISGSGFKAGASVWLVREDTLVEATAVEVTSFWHIRCRVASADMGPGSWDIMVENPDGESAVRKGGFLVSGFQGPLRAWGNDDYGQTGVPEGRDYIAASIGGNHGLALKADGSIVAWGLNDRGQAEAPEGNNYLAVSAGGYHSVALRADGTLLAWGDDSHGQLDAPPGDEFVAVSAGWFFSVALRADGSLVAWGDNEFGQLNVPPGNDFIAVSAGGFHALALRADGSLVAWGNNEYGQCDVPDESNFVSIAAGGTHSMA